MTTEERLVVVGLTLLILFGSGVRWYQGRYTSKPLAPGLAAPDSSAALLPADAVEEEVRVMELNEASREELELLPGIGPVKADRIVRLREERGGFRSVEELVEVHGIGPKTVERLRDLVTVGAGTTIEEGRKAAGGGR